MLRICIIYVECQFETGKTTQYNIRFTWNDEISPFIRLLSVSVDSYYNKVSDKIVAIPNMYIWKMMNMGEVEIKGIDVNLGANIPLYKTFSLLLLSAIATRMRSM